ncbi:MAG: LemA family protein [Proteobacteria bacterium]|nr:LemA family protein [Pseudomonadota bacterium]
MAVIYLWYTSIIKRRNSAEEAFSGIDVQLKKRTDLIPNILKIAQKFMEHEKSLLTEITKLRTEVLKLSQNKDEASVKTIKIKFREEIKVITSIVKQLKLDYLVARKLAYKNFNHKKKY